MDEVSRFGFPCCFTVCGLRGRKTGFRKLGGARRTLGSLYDGKIAAARTRLRPPSSFDVNPFGSFLPEGDQIEGLGRTMRLQSWARNHSACDPFSGTL